MKQTKVIENVGLLPFTTTILFHSIHRDNNILVYIAKKRLLTKSIDFAKNLHWGLVLPLVCRIWDKEKGFV